jgi:phosphoenolpyruvate carboxykinase (ATP)
LSGYSPTTKHEAGIEIATPEFSACFGEKYLTWHPSKYLDLFKKKLDAHDTKIWLVSTGYTGGRCGTGGDRIEQSITEAVVRKIMNGELDHVETQTIPGFNFEAPVAVDGVPSDLLVPKDHWLSKDEYQTSLDVVLDAFKKNFARFANEVPAEVANGGPN